MSADNWDKCPKCGKGDNTKHIMKEHRKYPIDHRGIPLREDYEIFWEGDKFNVYYKGHCYSCNFSHTFIHEETIT